MYAYSLVNAQAMQIAQGAQTGLLLTLRQGLEAIMTGWLWCGPGPAGHTKLRIYANHKPTT